VTRQFRRAFDIDCGWTGHRRGEGLHIIASGMGCAPVGLSRDEASRGSARAVLLDGNSVAVTAGCGRPSRLSCFIDQCVGEDH